MSNQDIELTVSDFVALLNQSLEFAFNGVVITGELANLRVSKNKWIYFDLKDEYSTVKFFGTVYQLPGPLEDGMVLKVRGLPKLHNLYGFSVNVINIQLAGEGTIKRAQKLLENKLRAEGLFDEERKRPIPYPPSSIGLITSKQSAAYADFIKIINARWRGINIDLIDVQVQGEVAPAQINSAISHFSSLPKPPEVIILIRGGGSPEDLFAFNTEQVARAVASSRVPTLVAIGHEIDLSLAELVADKRASTPSNAAELLVPDRNEIINNLLNVYDQLSIYQNNNLNKAEKLINDYKNNIQQLITSRLQNENNYLINVKKLLTIINPEAILKRGYAIVRQNNTVIKQIEQLKIDDIVNVKLAEGSFKALTKELNNDSKK